MQRRGARRRLRSIDVGAEIKEERRRANPARATRVVQQRTPLFVGLLNVGTSVYARLHCSCVDALRSAKSVEFGGGHLDRSTRAAAARHRCPAARTDPGSARADRGPRLEVSVRGSARAERRALDRSAPASVHTGAARLPLCFVVSKCVLGARSLPWFEYRSSSLRLAWAPEAASRLRVVPRVRPRLSVPPRLRTSPGAKRTPPRPLSNHRGPRNS
mmetsp:Transcript_14823/g.45997  ORF Transcript_14823/g.45997 Transcript_14823/m.45997 type:complete len:216 (-) Transcript_14823:435-1082(-)